MNLVFRKDKIEQNLKFYTVHAPVRAEILNETCVFYRQDSFESFLLKRQD